MYPLKGKVAIITGAAGGIGLGAARSLAERGVKVVLVDINAEKLKGAATGFDTEVLPVASDITAEGSFEEIRRAAEARFGGADILMNNAGAITRGLPQDLPVSEWQRVIDLNLMAT